jgi:hypothetical protein
MEKVLSKYISVLSIFMLIAACFLINERQVNAQTCIPNGGTITLNGQVIKEPRCADNPQPATYPIGSTSVTLSGGELVSEGYETFDSTALDGVCSTTNFTNTIQIVFGAPVVDVQVVVNGFADSFTMTDESGNSINVPKRSSNNSLVLPGPLHSVAINTDNPNAFILEILSITVAMPSNPAPFSGQIAVSPSSGSPGTLVNVSGTAFYDGPGAGTFEIIYDGAQLPGIKQAVSCFEQPSLNFTIPCGLPGQHSIVVQLVDSNNNLLCASAPTYYTIGGVLASTMPQIQIYEPANNSQFPLIDGNYNSTGTIPFSVISAGCQPVPNPVTFTLTLTYAGISQQSTFTTGLYQAVGRIINSAGGQLTVNASTKIGATTVKATQVTAYVPGPTEIPQESIVAMLTQLYGNAKGATPNLLTGVAAMTNFQQFVPATVNNQTLNYPNRSSSTSKQVGVMQTAPITMANAFDYTVNVSTAVSTFVNKSLPAATANMNSIIKSHSGLRKLNPVELENMALGSFSPYATTNLAQQYYTVSNGNWVVNTNGNPNLVNYVNFVRANLAQ